MGTRMTQMGRIFTDFFVNSFAMLLHKELSNLNFECFL